MKTNHLFGKLLNYLLECKVPRNLFVKVMLSWFGLVSCCLLRELTWVSVWRSIGHPSFNIIWISSKWCRLAWVQLACSPGVHIYHPPRCASRPVKNSELYIYIYIYIYIYMIIPLAWLWKKVITLKMLVSAPLYCHRGRRKEKGVGIWWMHLFQQQQME